LTHGDDADALTGWKDDPAFGGAQLPNHCQHLVVLGELAQTDHGLIGLARGIERNDPNLLAGDTAGPVDLVDGDLCCDIVGARERCKWSCARRQIT
jgi:hypothetical protein